MELLKENPEYTQKKNMNYYPARAEIQLNHLTHNMEVLRSRLNQSTSLMAVIKADAYGHGAVKVAKHLMENNVDSFAVSCVEEGIKLRNSGIEAPILILGPSLSEQVEEIIKFNLTPSLSDIQFARSLNSSVMPGCKIAVHIRVDIGLGSNGITSEEVISFVEHVSKLSNLYLEGFYTHLTSTYGTDKKEMLRDYALFNDILGQLGEMDIQFSQIHAGSSTAIYNLPEACQSMVRPGINDPVSSSACQTFR